MLESMKVVSFCHVLQGPAATQYLGDMGADIIKIEPLTGDIGRGWAVAEIYPGGVSSFYLAAARNKKSVSVNLKSPEGLELVFKLIAEADVVLENFRSGVMDRLGLTYEAMRKVNPSIIYASGTGWGSRGPMVGREGQDLLMQARSGIISANGGDRPRSVGNAIVDQHGGALLAMGVMSAFIRKQATGQGARVESSLYGAALDLQTEPLTAFLTGHPSLDLFKRNENLASWYHYAPYGVYEMVDGWVAVPAQDAKTIAEVLDDDRLREIAKGDVFDIRDAFAARFAEIIKAMTFEQVEALFRPADVWYGKVFDFEEVSTDPQAIANNAFIETEVNGDRLVLVNHPIRYDDQAPALRSLPVEIGENTGEAMLRLGYSEEQIRDMVQRGVVVAPGYGKIDHVMQRRGAAAPAR